MDLQMANQRDLLVLVIAPGTSVSEHLERRALVATPVRGELDDAVPGPLARRYRRIAEGVVIARTNRGERCADHREGAVQAVGDKLTAQLKEGGRVAAIFSEGALGVVRIGHKQDGSITWKFAFNASAPLLPDFEVADAFSL